MNQPAVTAPSTSTGDARLDALAVSLVETFGERAHELICAHGELTLVVKPADLLVICAELRDLPEFSFEQLIDLCGVDYVAFGQSEWETELASSDGFGRGVDREPDLDLDSDGRFAVVYHLLSLKHNRRLRLRVHAAGSSPMVDSVVPLWPVADWFERECFDLFGILFNGHPDLRRILTDYGFVGHPFRKDFPLSGQVEMRYDPGQQRVVYEPVSIEPRVLVPRVIRDDSRYLAEGPSSGGANA
ncbi:NADH-quinone oxidoreductase subunit C [Thiorhodovibrio frisius]|uniref:NADH-quinone oxidoreductase subunit C n=1 Tax=Thiorhodovibrio frisius TaxID=631362 RepID=H8YWT0_9GAMM|nr:NADH-quinone oxidoreductase subunit C [Thiorhodovibrio frisius]EIC22906.1 NADH:ubiquinone oxidoreductase 27 kD subunit [Thiorhodovibrio frisius]WPL22835.1 NADH-quinone oxidoreductase subunit C 1 [Thiorhodovibrio frisius]